jgi:N6-L-threonylcarbamoyladenine synthase
MSGNGLILAIESSCDETAAAIVQRGSRTLSSVVASQIATHSRYGGVVPELASREHLRAIVPVVRAALAQASLTPSDLDAIAVTSGPGLAGALLVGITYAKALAYAQNIPLIAVNHLEGHIHAVLLNEREQEKALTAAGLSLNPGAPSPASDSGEVITPNEQAATPGLKSETSESTTPNEDPALALVVSGGHTHLYLASPAHGAWTYSLVGRTVDDAAGEAFDKVAKLLGLGYPGGPWIDALAPYGDPRAIPFSFSQIKSKAHLAGKTARTKAAKTAPIANLDPHFLFSFSGIKTAVLRYVELHNFTGPDAPANPTVQAALATCDPQTLELIASFQHAVVGDLLKKTFAAQESLGASRILVTGGVAANRELRDRFTTEAARRNLRVAFPTLALSTDNAAMIAAAAWPRFQAGDFAPPNLSADPSLALGTTERA